MTEPKAGDLVWYIDWVDGTKPEIRGPSPLYQHPLYPGLSYEGVKDTRTYVARDGSERRQGNTRTFKFVGFDDSGRHTPDFSSHEKAKAWVVDFFDREVERVDQELNRARRGLAVENIAKTLGFLPRKVIAWSALSGEGMEPLWQAVMRQVGPPPDSVEAEPPGEQV